MSYNITYSKISAYYQGEGYSFSWAEDLSCDSRDMLKDILCSYNHTYSRLDGEGLNHVEIHDGIYFFLLDEGAVLFRVGGFLSDVCLGAALIGLYFKCDYVPSAWFLIDKLVQVVLSDGFYSLEGGVVSEEDLDRLYSEYKSGYMGINPDGETEMFSFAIAPIDPCLKTVHFTPNVGNGRIYNLKTDGKSVRNVESILAIKSIFPQTLVDERYKNILLERNQEEKKGLFKKPDPLHKPWGIKQSGNNYGGLFSELECLEDGKSVCFSSLIAEVDGIVGSQRIAGCTSQRRKAICMDK